MALSSNPRLMHWSERNGNSPALHENESVEFSADAELFLNEELLGNGTLFITSKRVILVPTSSTSDVVGFEYRGMVMHAIGSLESSGDKYIFVQLQDEDEDEEEGLIECVNGGVEQQETVLRLVPRDGSVVEELFQAMNEMSALNPDQDEEEFEEIMDEEVM